MLMDTNLKHFKYPYSSLEYLPSCVHIRIIWRDNPTVYLNLQWSICVVAFCGTTEMNLENGGRKLLRNVLKCLPCYRRHIRDDGTLHLHSYEKPRSLELDLPFETVWLSKWKVVFPIFDTRSPPAEICGQFILVSSLTLCLSSFFLFFIPSILPCLSYCFIKSKHTPINHFVSNFVVQI